ncbi:STAS domain-containing protein [Azospirillum sp. B4]|uniref:STAS domain-containing protein n=1 Tax=Azospirillum sp. B4 TaxID=95605 RepID=UPI000346B378|nr:STAS domain-containing protein [Azospirillum sp. B4]
MGNASREDVGKVVFDGSRTIRNADETHAILMAAGKSHAVVEIECGALDEVDLSFVQLLIAARNGARRDRRVVRLAGPVSGVLRDALQRGGFLTAVGLAAGATATADQTADHDFWLHTEAR